MPPFLQLMNRIHKIVGNRVTYVVSVPDGYPGLVYFVADLNPAPIPEDPWTLVMNEPERLAFLQDFRRHVLPQTQAIVSHTLGAPEVRYFLRRYPDARKHRLLFGTSRPYWVLVS